MSLLNKFRPPKSTNSMKAIIEHLNDLLNTKREFGNYPRDYGLDSYIYLGSNEKIILKIIDDIHDCLNKYEKRVSDVEVIHMNTEDPFTRTFLITCKIEAQHYSFHLSFQAQKHFYQLEAVE